ncbi:MAG: hypothetical protein AYL29_005560 [Candidatus Bathyarchaeota archaeon B24]|nr:MAG: hypothetical protein AYL29_005560 [Candidatus Bathyarchaeota archaeon B24]RLI26472.1 MAG: hypothetical protein DRO57_01140 [Candidatus Bathyarchaeota archaeon]
MKLRSITLYLSPKSWDTGYLKEYVESRVSSLNEAVETVKPHIEVWSLRVSTPPPPSGIDLIKAAETIYEASADLGVSLVSGFTLDAEDLDPGLLTRLLESGVYVSVKMKREDYSRNVSKALVEVAYRNPVLLADVAVIPRDLKGFLTPYFPLSVNINPVEGLAVALLYPMDLLNAYEKGGWSELSREASRMISEAEMWGRKLSSRLKVEFYGVDYSISPWMEDSSARLVEAVSGVPIPEPGSVAAVAKLNRMVQEAASKVGVKETGFCELMLPVAEDDILKLRGREGRLRLRDLVALSTVCVAGVDMAVIPADDAIPVVEKLMEDVYQISRFKRRVLGVRVIPYPGVEPGDNVQLGFFGEVPVIPP